MTVKLSKVWGLVQTGVVSRLGQSVSTTAKANYWVSKFVNKIKDEYKIVDEARQDLIKQYGKENEDKSFNVLPENMEVFMKEFAELLEAEVDLNIPNLNVEYLEGRNLSVDDFTALDFAINQLA